MGTKKNSKKFLKNKGGGEIAYIRALRIVGNMDITYSFWGRAFWRYQPCEYCLSVFVGYNHICSNNRRVCDGVGDKVAKLKKEMRK